ncbi:hypothetical protein JMJ35_004860 [Cladonia borealis]|uniref:Uncharacterized protein n=1 Tax=Cladonia borealis TaxID=184061 RepID=A0AA39R3V0_9LECA|nr:hypothetical protein JMJ35_004860 [Cladonia borealis]
MAPTVQINPSPTTTFMVRSSFASPFNPASSSAFYNMVRLRELLDDIFDSVSGNDDDTWKVEIHNSREQRQMSFDTVVPRERKMVLELRVLNQDVSNNDETAATSEAGYSPYQDPGSHDVGQMNETDKGTCSEDKYKGDNKASMNHACAEERSNHVEKKGEESRRIEKGQGDAHIYIYIDGAEDEEEDIEEEEEDTEAEEEKERVRAHASELRTVDGVRKPAEIREKPPLTTSRYAR